MTGPMTNTPAPNQRRGDGTINDSEIPIPPSSESGGSDELVEDFGDGKVKFKFKRMKDRVPGQSWILMVYGASKTGKTYFAGTAGPRTLYVNVGEGDETLLAPAFTQKHPASAGMISVDIREMNPQNMPEAFDMVCDAIDHALKTFPDKFDTIVLDEATALRKFAMNKAMQLNTEARTQGTRKNRMTEYVKVDIGDYGEEMNMINWFLGEYIPIFKGAGKHFLMLAHERQVFGKPSKIGDDAVLKRVLPGFTGKTHPDQVPSFFDDVWHSEMVTDASSTAEYRMRTAGNDIELAGARHGGIFETVEKNPNYLKMLERIKAAQPRAVKPPLPTAAKR